MLDIKDLFHCLILPITAIVLLTILISEKLHGRTFDQTLNDLVYDGEY